MKLLKEEYVSLRDEIIHLDDSISSVLNFFYTFIATFLAFSLTQDDTIYLLLSHIITLPAYLLIIGKRMGQCKISAYLQVFGEGEEINWETRQTRLKIKKGPQIFVYVHATHFPFLLVNISVLILFIYRTRWDSPVTTYILCKSIFEIAMFFILLGLTVQNRKLSKEDYVNDWRRIQMEEEKEKSRCNRKNKNRAKGK